MMKGKAWLWLDGQEKPGRGRERLETDGHGAFSTDLESVDLAIFLLLVQRGGGELTNGDSFYRCKFPL